jgi:predicted amidohydrolase
MPEPLVLAVAQPRCVDRDVAANAASHAETIRRAAARVVVFPELSLTGYHLDCAALAADDPRLAPIVAACAETGSIALAGAPVPGPHIGVLRFDAAGATVAYRKMWLGGVEPRWFVAGTAPAVVEVDGWRLGLAVCRDTGVEAHAADTAALGIDGYLAGVLEHAADAAVVDQRARRIAAAHRVWVAIASFAGSTGGGYQHAAGRSAIWAADGTVLSQAGPEVDAIATATVS